jgi:hypothetical protein
MESCTIQDIKISKILSITSSPLFIIYCFSPWHRSTAGDQESARIKSTQAWRSICLNMAASDAGLRQRLIPESETTTDWDPDLPYGGKVYLARKKKPDPTYVKVIEVSTFKSAHLVISYLTWHKTLLGLIMHKLFIPTSYVGPRCFRYWLNWCVCVCVCVCVW